MSTPNEKIAILDESCEKLLTMLRKIIQTDRQAHQELKTLDPRLTLDTSLTDEAQELVTQVEQMLETIKTEPAGLICHACKVDRTQAPCPRAPGSCGLKVEAQNEK